MNKFSLTTSLVNKEKFSVRKELKTTKKVKGRPDSKNGHLSGSKKKGNGKNAIGNKAA